MQASQSEIVSGSDPGGYGIAASLVGRSAAVLFWTAGLVTVIVQLLPASLGLREPRVLICALFGPVIGTVCWLLPWHRWPRWCTYPLVPLAFLLIAVATIGTDASMALAGVYYCAVFTLIGLVYRRGIGLATLPLFVIAYAGSRIIKGDPSSAILAGTVEIGAICVASAEMIAWLGRRLFTSQEALSRAHSAVNDISAGLALGNSEAIAADAVERLSQLTEAATVHVYRLRHVDDDGYRLCLGDRTRAECLASATCGRELSEHESEAVQRRAPVVVSEGQATSLAILPLVARNVVIGLAEIDGLTGSDEVLAERINLALSVCRLIALSMQDADALQLEVEQGRRLASLLESSKAIALAGSAEEALAIVTRSAANALGVTECVAWEYDRQTDTLTARAM